MTPLRGSGTQASQNDTVTTTLRCFGRSLRAGALAAGTAVAVLSAAHAPAQAPGMSFDPGAHLSFSMPLGGSPETDLEITLDITNGYRSIISFDVRGYNSNDRVRLGGQRSGDWRAEYRRMLNEDRRSPRASEQPHRQERRHSGSSRTASQARSAREHYLSLLARYEAASTAEQRALYPELQRAYRAALDSR